MGTDGQKLWGVGDDGILYCLQGATWEALVGDHHWQNVAMSGDGKLAFGVDDKGWSWHCDALVRPLVWTRSAIDFIPKSVSLNEDGSILWAVASNDSVNFGSPNSTEWVGGWLDNLTISANVRDVWGVNANGDVYHRSGAEGFWV